MVDNNIHRTLNSLHINKSNQVDILIDPSCFKTSSTKITTFDIEADEDDYHNILDSQQPLQLSQEHQLNNKDHQIIIQTNTNNIISVSDGLQQQQQQHQQEPHQQQHIQQYHQQHSVDEISTENSNNIHITEENLLMQLNKICRCCLTERNDLRSLFDDCIPEMIMTFASVQISIDDTLPSQICMHCILQVSKALALKQQLETADATLRQFIQQGYLEGMKLSSLDTVQQDTEEGPIDPNQYKCNVISDDNSNNIAELNDIAYEPQEQQTIHDNSQQSHSNNNLFDNSVEDYDTNINDVYNDEEDYQNDPPPVQLLEEQQQQHQEKYVENDGSNQNNNTSSNELNDLESDKITSPSRVCLSPHTIQMPMPINKEHEEDGLSSGSTIMQYKQEQPVDIIDTPLRTRFSRRKSSKPLKTIEEQNDLRTLSAIKEEPNLEWSCFICKKGFPDKRKLTRHKKTHKDGKAFHCTTCSKSFSERAHLNKHLLRHYSTAEQDVQEFKFNCSKCHTGFNVERDLEIHNSVHRTDGKIICVECDKEFSTNIQLKRHVRIHFDDKPHKCRICSKGFPERGSLTRHFRKHTGEHREKKHECSVCDKKYYDTHSLNVHMRIHTGERPWVCKTCGKSFIDSRLLHSHEKVHSEEKPYSCKMCDKRFTHQSTLTTHIRTHTGEKPYICTVCGKSFIQSSNLSLHMRVHSGERPYACSVCDRTFASSSTLTMHNRIHTGEKPYTCPVCNKRFARHDLSAHIRTHTGEKPYECTTCTKKFTTSGQLNQHLRTHTGEKPFVCDVCNKACSSSNYLKKHKKLHCNDKQQLQLLLEMSLSSKRNHKKNNSDVQVSEVVNEPEEDADNDENTIYVNINDENLDQIDDRTIYREVHDLYSSQDVNGCEQAADNELEKDLIHVVNENISMQSWTDENEDMESVVILQTDKRNIRKRNIYQAIDPSIIRIQHVHSVVDESVQSPGIRNECL